MLKSTMIHPFSSKQKKKPEKLGRKKKREVVDRETAPSKVNRGSIVLRGLTGSCRSGDKETRKKKKKTGGGSGGGGEGEDKRRN